MLSKLIDKLHGWLDTLVLMLPNLAVAVLVLGVFWLLSIYVRQLVYRVLARISDRKAFNSLMATLTRIGCIAASSGKFWKL